jgi:hypothetical protein
MMLIVKAPGEDVPVYFLYTKNSTEKATKVYFVPYDPDVDY